MTVAVEPIRFITTIGRVNGVLIARLPQDASKQLPSRGQVAATVHVAAHDTQTVVEPDGDGGHWLRIDELEVPDAIGEGDELTVLLTPLKQWPEPAVPGDLATALAGADESVREKWHDITPMARWEWVRWIGATANLATRAIRVEKTISKLAGTHRRPCCFNLASCTDPAVSKSGHLIDVRP